MKEKTAPMMGVEDWLSLDDPDVEQQLEAKAAERGRQPREEGSWAELFQVEPEVTE